MIECRKSKARGTPPYELALVEYPTKTAADEERVYAFEWERIPHIATNAQLKRKALPVELLCKILGFVLDSSILDELFISENSGKGHVRAASPRSPICYAPTSGSKRKWLLLCTLTATLRSLLTSPLLSLIRRTGSTPGLAIKTNFLASCLQYLASMTHTLSPSLRLHFLQPRAYSSSDSTMETPSPLQKTLVF
jgi:hypothetical protein